jgi:phosphoribosylaminoimidazole-succinocarboxamide synthase
MIPAQKILEAAMNDEAIFETSLDNLELIARGKVRDIYAIDDDHMLIVTTDRFSAFDVVFDEPIPHKGELLTEVSNFWFDRTAGLIANHLTDLDLRDYVSAADYERLRARSIIVRRLETLPVEAIVRGYIIGSGWKDYQATGQICGIELPPGLQQAAQLPEPIFTPSTKAEVGDHDINVSFDDIVAKIGSDKANAIRQKSIELYRQAADYARERGIIIADTKFEFGVDSNDELVLIDEILTPDSSRRRATTSSSCGITWRLWIGTKPRRHPVCRPISSPKPCRSISRCAIFCSASVRFLNIADN